MVENLIRFDLSFSQIPFSLAYFFENTIRFGSIRVNDNRIEISNIPFSFGLWSALAGAVALFI
jgi:hypothetical protein